MKKLTKKNISGTSVELFEAKYLCPCVCTGCDCTICSSNDETWMNTVSNQNDTHYQYETVNHTQWI